MGIADIIHSFGFDKASKVSPLGSGLINKTFLVQDEKKDIGVLQEINTNVFKDPEVVMRNLERIIGQLKSSNYPFGVFDIIKTNAGDSHLEEPDCFWRMITFLDGEEAAVGVNNKGKAQVVSEGYGLFLKYLNQLKPTVMQEVIPNFHDPESRFQQLLEAIDSTTKERLRNAGSLVDHAVAFSGITVEYSDCCKNTPLRITHGDAKASNILVDVNGDHIIGIIDLDTVMPGYLMNDFGDMVRSMCNTGKEDERDTDKVSLDLQNFTGITNGFLHAIDELLEQEELDSLLTGVKAILYEQFIRFLTDYLNKDVYYGAEYPEQNLVRAKVHLKLLIDYQEKQEDMTDIINKCLREL